ncbi:unnamed protein product, partial [Mesorhabditis belari]|uniref:Protein kinase domain-containing protein n=1 Tax=Mesorhabditis belari TaxID=2138241 RepID=A0AAF3EW86_9BILA
MGKFTAKRIHGPRTGAGEMMDIVLSNQRICGAGRFSNVYVAKLEEPVEMTVAIKNVWLTATSGKYSKENSKDHVPSTEPLPNQGGNYAYAEIGVLAMIRHPHIVRLLYHFSKPTETDECYSLVLDFLPQELGKLLKTKKQPFNVLETKVLSWQIFNALEYLNAYDIAHLDIKPNNLILDESTLHLKLSDFGNARVLNKEADYLSYQVTRFYRAPELLFGGCRFTTLIDVWAAGCVMAEICTGKVLFRAPDPKNQARLVVEVLGYPTDEDVKAMDVGRPRVRRGTTKGILAHQPQLPKEMISVLQKIFIYNVQKRASAARVMTDEFFAELKTLPKRPNGVPIKDFGYAIEEQPIKATKARLERSKERMSSTCHPAIKH